MRILGQRAERIAERYLSAKGLELISRNYHCRQGELDLVMMDGNELVFVEVRHRSQSSYGSATDSIAWPKRKRLIAAANCFLADRHYGLNQYCRFDVVSFNGKLSEANIDWIKNAFSE